MVKAAVITFILLSIFCRQRESLCALGPDPYKIIAEEAKEEPRANEISRPSVEFKNEGIRDPFIIFMEEKKTVKTLDSVEVTSLPGDFLVQGLIWGGRLNQAVIKNKVVKAGDTLDEVKILEIGKNGVSVFYKGRKFDLSSPALIKAEEFQKAGGQDEK